MNNITSIRRFKIGPHMDPLNWGIKFEDIDHIECLIGLSARVILYDGEKQTIVNYNYYNSNVLDEWVTRGYLVEIFDKEYDILSPYDFV